MKHIDIYTDGSCLGNPGAGGWAAILVYNQVEKEIYGSELDTTNNRMELTAAIEGLSALRESCEVSLYTDSKYVSDAINKGWLDSWAKKAFYGRKNAELWKQLLGLLQQHKVSFIWVKGHSDNVYNERCDKLAVSQAKMVSTYGNMYKKREFVSEAEALEWSSINNIQIDKIKHSSYGVEVYYIDNNIDINTLSLKDYIIGTLTYTGGTMYITEKGTSFNINEAKKFTKEEATSKAKAMRERSKRDYQWKAIKGGK